MTPTFFKIALSNPLLGSNGRGVKLGSRFTSAVIDALEKAKLAPSDADATELLQHVKKITLHRDEVEILLHGIKDKQPILRIPAGLTSGKAADRLIRNDGANQRNEPLIKAIALGSRWRTKLETGEHKSAIALARSEGYSLRYVWKTLRLAFLAPDIVDAILDGRHPPHLSLHKLNDLPLDGDWRLQRRTLGFESRS